MSKINYIDMGCYPIWVGVTDSLLSYDKEMKRLGIKSPPPFVLEGKDATTHFFKNSEQQSICIICIDKNRAKNKKTVQIMSLLVHEAVHVWQECKEIMGETSPGREIEAYAIQWISQCCINAIS